MTIAAERPAHPGPGCPVSSITALPSAVSRRLTILLRPAVVLRPAEGAVCRRAGRDKEVPGWLAEAEKGESGHGDCFGVSDELNPVRAGTVRVAVRVLAEGVEPVFPAMFQVVWAIAGEPPGDRSPAGSHDPASATTRTRHEHPASQRNTSPENAAAPDRTEIPGPPPPPRSRPPRPLPEAFAPRHRRQATTQSSPTHPGHHHHHSRWPR
jgi:hypothetical protein